MKNLYKIKWLNIILLVILTSCMLSMAGFSQEKKIIIKLGHHHTMGGIVDQTAQKLSEIVKEKSNGNVEIHIYPGAQLGQEKEACEGILMGTLQMTIVSPSFYDTTAKGFGVDVLPFIYKDIDQINMVLNESSVGKELGKRLLEKGGRILGWFPLGSREMIFIEKEIKTFKEFKGLKMRSPENEMWVEMFRALGSGPTAITWGECYTALQTGIVDGMESPLANVKDMKFYEVIEYCLLTHHMMAEMIMVINEKYYQGLPEDIQKIIIEAGREAVDYATQLTRAVDKEVVVWLTEQGIKFNEVSEEDFVKFKEALTPMVDKWAKAHDCTDLVEDIRKLVE